MNDIVHVAAGVIYNNQGEILLARRAAHAYQGGLWEFPGGQREANESIEQALKRELEEELELTVRQARPLIRVYHTYPEKKILLDVWQVEQWQGSPWGREGQLVRWCAPDLLKNYDFPAANLAIVTAIQLPSLYSITPEPASSTDKSFFYALEAVLDSGISLLQFRAHHLSERDYSHCAEKTLALCGRYAAQLLVNATPKMALSIGSHGVHLNRHRLLSLQERPLAPHLWVAASCHSLEEIQQARQVGVDFLVLSPVHQTPSHPPNTPLLGWLKFFQWVEQAHCPVFALGGMTAKDIPKAWVHGAQGIAAIRGIWTSSNEDVIRPLKTL